MYTNDVSTDTFDVDIFSLNEVKIMPSQGFGLLI